LDNLDNILINELDTKNINKHSVHLRIQQRNTRKYITLIEGLIITEDYKIFLKKIKKKFSCNGSLLKIDDNVIIQLQGDHRQTLTKYFIDNNMYEYEQIKCHGF